MSTLLGSKQGMVGPGRLEPLVGQYLWPSAEMHANECGYFGTLHCSATTFQATRMVAYHHPDFNIVFLPANTTSRTQPLDQGVIASFKVKYRHALVCYHRVATVDKLVQLRKQNSDREKIVSLRQQQKLSYRTIGERFGVS